MKNNEKVEDILEEYRKDNSKEFFQANKRIIKY